MTHELAAVACFVLALIGVVVWLFQSQRAHVARKVRSRRPALADHCTRPTAVQCPTSPYDQARDELDKKTFGTHFDWSTMSDDEFMDMARLMSPQCTNFSQAARGRGTFADLGTVALDPETAERVHAEFVGQTGHTEAGRS